jgi:hypothetical protein
MRLTEAGYYLRPLYVGLLRLIDVRSVEDRKIALGRHQSLSVADRLAPIE